MGTGLKKTFASRVREARKERNISQFQMAKQMDLGSVVSISNWENEKSYCDMGTLEKIADFFGKPPHWFLTPPDDPVDLNPGLTICEHRGADMFTFSSTFYDEIPHLVNHELKKVNLFATLRSAALSICSNMLRIR